MVDLKRTWCCWASSALQHRGNNVGVLYKFNKWWQWYDKVEEDSLKKLYFFCCPEFICTIHFTETLYCVRSRFYRWLTSFCNYFLHTSTRAYSISPLLFPSGLSTEGIYRVSGNKAEMETLQRQFDQGGLCSSHNAHTNMYTHPSACSLSLSAKFQRISMCVSLLLSVRILTLLD